MWSLICAEFILKFAPKSQNLIPQNYWKNHWIAKINCAKFAIFFIRKNKFRRTFKFLNCKNKVLKNLTFPYYIIFFIRKYVYSFFFQDVSYNERMQLKKMKKYENPVSQKLILQFAKGIKWFAKINSAKYDISEVLICKNKFRKN